MRYSVLRELHLKSFKRFLDAKLPLSTLTALTGLNSGGKSSAMQSMLFMHHGASDQCLFPATKDRLLRLNAPGLFLGDKGKLLHEAAEDETFSIGFTCSEGYYTTYTTWSFGGADCERDSLAVPVVKTPPADADETIVTNLLRALQNLQFIPADRFGPADSYPLEAPFRHHTPGPRAERSFGNLWWFGQEPLAVPAMLHPDSDIPPTLLRQAEARLSDLFPRIELQVQRVNPTNLMTLGIRTADDNDFHTPHNVGFGVTYVLPIIISLLIAKQNDLVLIENPEAHLHPKAQSYIAKLCAKAAAAGVQVIIETHSDHILNGIRLAVHGGELPPDQVSILFFKGPSQDETDIFEHIRVQRNGQLTQWPEGFFDEADYALDQLLGRPGGEAP